MKKALIIICLAVCVAVVSNWIYSWKFSELSCLKREFAKKSFTIIKDLNSENTDDRGSFRIYLALDRNFDIDGKPVKTICFINAEDDELFLDFRFKNTWVSVSTTLFGCDVAIKYWQAGSGYIVLNDPELTIASLKLSIKVLDKIYEKYKTTEDYKKNKTSWSGSEKDVNEVIPNVKRDLN